LNLKLILVKKQVAFLFAALIMISFSFAQHNKHADDNKKKPTIHYGTASYYANKFEGRKTANGEIFSQKKMTAACNIISLNTWVKVTNMHNKKTAVVRITDRMHHSNKRLIDMSHSAAKQLGYTGRGVARVKVEVLGKKLPAAYSVGGTE